MHTAAVIFKSYVQQSGKIYLDESRIHQLASLQPASRQVSYPVPVLPSVSAWAARSDGMAASYSVTCSLVRLDLVGERVDLYNLLDLERRSAAVGVAVDADQVWTAVVDVAAGRMVVETWIDYLPSSVLD